MSNDFLSSIGIHAKEMAIGFQSALVGVFLIRKPTARTILGCVAACVFSANLFGPAIASFLGFSNYPYYEATIGASGIAGSAICYGIIHAVKRRISLFEEKMK